MQHEGYRDMSEQMGTEIAELSSQIEEMDDPRQCYRLVKERITRYQQMGSDVPSDLASLERQLMAECMAESQGR